MTSYIVILVQKVGQSTGCKTLMFCPVYFNSASFVLCINNLVFWMHTDSYFIQRILSMLYSCYNSWHYDTYKKNITASYTIYWKWWKPAAPTWPRHLLLSSSFPLVFLQCPSCDLKLFMCNVTLPDFVHRGHFHPIRGSSWISCLYRRARRLSNPPASHHITWPCAEFLAEKTLQCRLHHYWANESMNLWKYWN